MFHFFHQKDGHGTATRQGNDMSYIPEWHHALILETAKDSDDYTY